MGGGFGVGVDLLPVPNPPGTSGRAFRREIPGVPVDGAVGEGPFVVPVGSGGGGGGIALGGGAGEADGPSSRVRTTIPKSLAQRPGSML